ncbi:39S ribosomal protein L33, mitochondrial [Camponotus floridanus]|uniref:Large ribosomal subunit protein bL33m n=1 Tax=Camponotus floridanus TaxID=104421 RepID=E2AFD0_CAMFO|nr:39S ribosomal protein L33, mitochondrial [Camponotus floridanus]EFN67823.1 39S ribosomal protein L33, mitochondrial [Camponotus floridanus]
MFLTNTLLKKPKAKFILVLTQSIVSGHQLVRMRERLADKLEFIRFDPLVQSAALYREKKKIRSIR